MPIEKKKLRNSPICNSLQPPYVPACPRYPVLDIFNQYPSLLEDHTCRPCTKYEISSAVLYFDFLMFLSRRFGPKRFWSLKITVIYMLTVHDIQIENCGW